MNFLARMPAAVDCFRMIVLTVLNFLPYLMTSCPFSTVGFCVRMRAWERFFPKLTGSFLVEVSVRARLLGTVLWPNFTDVWPERIY